MNMDYIALENLDLSKFDDPVTRKELANKFFKALTGTGFFTVSNHGITNEQWDQQMDLAHAVMTMTPEEKKVYEVSYEDDKKGVYCGFKIAGGPGYHPKVDFYNMLLNDKVVDREVPPILKPYMPETRHIMDHVRDVVHYKLLVLLAMSLELPEKDVLSSHLPGAASSEYYRFSGYAPLTAEEKVKSRGLFMPGHADWGTFSILFSQTIAALQVLDYQTGSFKWVEHVPYALIVNIGQGLEVLTGGLYKATIHRVLTPPADQAHELRVGLFYFSRANDDYLMLPMAGSPVLKRLGLDKPLDPDNTFTATEFLEAKKHGYMKPDFDHDKPKGENHADMFRADDRYEVAKPLVSYDIKVQ
ncbi:Flavanone 3-dioxygenase [Lachnellula hyalina]|uniref:Flavanone 3-dioxygenase n=1 Tax=Lachnellula hyalina TaxID=1316788 RepID=A0A8H8R7M7_9HELO|nr:Flavanone 3-dioxygenase [Lachnellula hyalina]TVY29195.1 Flavanone 3-dioxygenase [Lachnellula hyalina]